MAAEGYVKDTPPVAPASAEEQSRTMRAAWDHFLLAQAYPRSMKLDYATLLQDPPDKLKPWLVYGFSMNSKLLSLEQDMKFNAVGHLIPMLHSYVQSKQAPPQTTTLTRVNTLPAKALPLDFDALLKDASERLKPWLIAGKLKGGNLFILENEMRLGGVENLVPELRAFVESKRAAPTQPTRVNTAPAKMTTAPAKTTLPIVSKAELQGKRLGEVKRIACERGISDEILGECDGADNPMEAVIEQILKKQAEVASNVKTDFQGFRSEILSRRSKGFLQRKWSESSGNIVDADPVHLDVSKIVTKPIAGQTPGTSGLRKKTKVFMDGAYLHNYVQSVLNTLNELDVKVAGGTLVVSGDGRFWNKEAIQIIIKIALANGVKRIWCGTGGLLSTPATSAVIRCRGSGFEPFGGFICSASHNPGGINDDFGIKYNCENGGPAPEKMTDKMVEWTAKITEFKICNRLPHIDLTVPRTYEICDRVIEVFDCVEDHLALLKNCFDFELIKKMVAKPEFSMVYDSMCGVQGPYAKKIIEGELGAKPGSATNAEPKEDFGGPDSLWHGHADPNLTYAVELVATMGLDKGGNKIDTPNPPPLFGAAADGDADRNMILSSQFFISPSDSLAILVANASLIPQFKNGLKGCARSMLTSGAVDRVAQKLGIDCFETPTGWKFFGNLMDSGTAYFPDKKVYRPFICGEESFGTGADHVREKDGMWAVLAWLQILAAKSEAAGKVITCEDVANEHWKEFGRNYYARYDYEGVDKVNAEEMMNMLGGLKLAGTELGGMKVKMNDVFEYTDPVDGSTSKNQGIRIIFEDGSRIIFRLSGTGVAGATIRMYLEKYMAADGDLGLHQFEVVKPLATIALEISKLKEFTGRDEPSVIT